MSGGSAWICGMGLVTAVGGCTAQTVSSVRAGISAYRHQPVLNKRFKPITMALVPNQHLPPVNDELRADVRLTAREARMLRLAQMAIAEAMNSVPGDAGAEIPLLMAGPESIPGTHGSTGPEFLGYLEIQSQVALDLGASRLFSTGRAGGMQALLHALALLKSGKHDRVLLGGVDSYLDLHLLGTLDLDDRLLADGAKDGFAPGEGAGFLVLCSDQIAESMPESPKTRLLTPGLDEESGHRYSEQPYRGDGLSAAMKKALKPLQGIPVEAVYSSMNGESFHAKEWGVGYVRHASVIDPNYRFEHPADCFGDLGAAAMPVLCGLASSALENGHLQRAAVVLCSSDGADRGAVCVVRG